nr:HAD-IA family hydrolase [Micromonospora terminaliae]
MFHTLVPGGDPERDRVVGEMALMVGVEPAALVEAYHATWRDRMTGWDAAETVRVLARRLGGAPTEEQVARAAAHRRELARRLLSRVRPSTVAVLDALRADGHRIGLVSNATAETAEAWPSTDLARRFDVAVFSCDVHLAKPDPAIYRLAAERLGVAPDECVFVGDGADGELAGAAAVGMTVVRTTEHNDTDPSWAGRALTALGELPDLLHEPARGR